MMLASISTTFQNIPNHSDKREHSVQITASSLKSVLIERFHCNGIHELYMCVCVFAGGQCRMSGKSNVLITNDIVFSF